MRMTRNMKKMSLNVILIGNSNEVSDWLTALWILVVRTKEPNQYLVVNGMYCTYMHNSHVKTDYGIPFYIISFL